MGKVAKTREQMAQLKEIFSKFDVDGDGSLTVEELGTMLRSLGLNPNREQVELVICKADTNSNGLVEFHEFVALIGPETIEGECYNQQVLHALFRRFDRDGNGYITAVELTHAMAKMGYVLSPRELTEMFREADIDGDGLISFSEFVTAMTNAASETISSFYADVENGIYAERP